jgi:hypothetical protein
MLPIYPNTGTDFLANAIRTLMVNCVAKTFKNNVSVNAGTILSNLQESTYSGYGAITNATLLPVYRAPGGGSTFQIPTDQWNYYQPSGVSAIAVGAGGTGYTSVPTVTITGGGGSGATATAALTGTAVSSITVTNAGQGYTSAPTVTITGGAGSGATGTATIANLGQGVATINVTTPGSGYTTPPTVAFSGGGGSGAVATAQISGGVVTGLTIINPGSGYTTPPTIAFSGGGGSGAAATTTVGLIQEVVYGWYVLDATGVLIIAANYDQPITMQQAGDAIPQDIAFNFKN